MDDLIRLGFWDADMKNELVAANGSVQVIGVLAFWFSVQCAYLHLHQHATPRLPQDLDIPANLKELYKTVWEIKQRVLVDMAAGDAYLLPRILQVQYAMLRVSRQPQCLCNHTRHCADRGAFIDQSQSFNVHMSDPNFGKLTSLHFYAWKKGLKTGDSQGYLLSVGECALRKSPRFF